MIADPQSEMYGSLTPQMDIFSLGFVMSVRIKCFVLICMHVVVSEQQFLHASFATSQIWLLCMNALSLLTWISCMHVLVTAHEITGCYVDFACMFRSVVGMHVALLLTWFFFVHVVLSERQALLLLEFRCFACMLCLDVLHACSVY